MLFNKKLLLTPGPTPIPDSVARALSKPMIHHRTSEFQQVFDRVKEGLKKIFGTENDVLVLACTGSGAMDATVSNLFSPGDKVITINGGKFGKRWTAIARAYGLNAVEIYLEPGRTLPVDLLRETVSQNTDAKGILFQASETSTGTLMPTREIAALAKEFGMLSICDAITASGILPLPMDEWELDVVISGSQKALMLPPGLAVISLSQRAWKFNENASLPKYYFDLKKERKAQRSGQTAWSPATGLILALDESLNLIFSEGLPSIYERNEVLAKATRNAVEALGLELLSEAPSPAVTAVIVPANLPSGNEITEIMSKRYGVTIAGGQDDLKGRIFRLSHFGYCGPFDMTTAVACLELTLAELGHPVQFGAGVGAFLKTLSEHCVQQSSQQ